MQQSAIWLLIVLISVVSVEFVSRGLIDASTRIQFENEILVKK